MNLFLVIGGILSICAALLHIAIVIKGPAWYRFFGAGEKMASMAEQKLWQPTIITLSIAMVLFAWGLYAFSATGLIYPLPLLKPAIIAITVVYLVRGLVLIPGYIFIPDKVDGFAFWSSIVCFIFGLFYAIGAYQVWDNI